MRSLKMLLKLPVIVISIYFSGCTSSDPSIEWQKAWEIHEEIIAMESETRSIFDSVEQVIASDSSLRQYSGELTQLDSEMKQWESAVIEVGEETLHENHPHAHLSAKELTDAQLLEVQNQQKAKLATISRRLSNLVEKMMNQ